MKKLIRQSWYLFLKTTFKIGLFFSLKKLTVKGKENIPKEGAVIFIGNHQNAFIDAILIPTTNGRTTYFLARSNPFQNKYIAKILNLSNMYPVYRIQDGVDTIKKNHIIFEACHQILRREQALEIFAEGIHHLDRKVYKLKKGFGRIIFGTLKKYPDLKIKIVPVGINYDHHIKFRASASVIYGEPIVANDYIQFDNPDLTFEELKEVVEKALKKLTLHIEETENYDEVVAQIEALDIDYLNPEEAYKTYNNRNALKPKKQSSGTNLFSDFLHFIWQANSLIPLFLWKRASKKITEIIFTSTFRFAFILVVFPLFYLLQSGIVGYFFGMNATLLYLTTSVLLSIIIVKTDTIQRSTRPE